MYYTRSLTKKLLFSFQTSLSFFLFFATINRILTDTVVVKGLDTLIMRMNAIAMPPPCYTAVTVFFGSTAFIFQVMAGLSPGGSAEVFPN